jgi:hypothetical protein
MKIQALACSLGVKGLRQKAQKSCSKHYNSPKLYERLFVSLNAIGCNGGKQVQEQ